MFDHSLSHLSDSLLSIDLPTVIAGEQAATATALAYLAEFDTRRLYRAAAYPSMHAYCVGKLRLPKDGAFKHICAARTARKFPVIFQAVADGRLHLTAVVLLAPHLNHQNAAQLLKSAEYKSSFEIKQILAQWFPRLDDPIECTPSRRRTARFRREQGRSNWIRIQSNRSAREQ